MEGSGELVPSRGPSAYVAKGEPGADGLEWLGAAGLSAGGVGPCRREACQGSDPEQGSQRED